MIRWQLFVSLFFGFVTIFCGVLAGYLWANPHYHDASAVFALFSMDAMLLTMGFAQGDGAKMVKRK